MSSKAKAIPSVAINPIMRAVGRSNITHLTQSSVPRQLEFSAHGHYPRRPCIPTMATPAAQQASTGAHGPVADGSVSVVLLAGGVGKRMGASIPKQYVSLRSRIPVYSSRSC